MSKITSKIPIIFFTVMKYDIALKQEVPRGFDCLEKKKEKEKGRSKTLSLSPAHSPLFFFCAPLAE